MWVRRGLFLLKKTPWAQGGWEPSRQKSQTPSEKGKGITKKKTFFTFLPSRPSTSYTPTASCPTPPPPSSWTEAWYGHRSLPQIHARTVRISASVDSLIVASGTFSTRTSPGPNIIVALINLLSCGFRALVVLCVSNVLHPFNHFSVEHFLNGDVRH